MKTPMRQSTVTLSLIAICICAAAHALCKPGDPTGYFEGTATSMQAGKLEVSLNLTCPDGNYSGELVSPVGTYQVKGRGICRRPTAAISASRYERKRVLLKERFTQVKIVVP
jgi:hypothetical protein